MKAQASPDNPVFDFSFPQFDTFVRVEHHGDTVTIRATRDAFTLAHKEMFIRELAAEGFIAPDYGWSGLRNLTWQVDRAWLQPSPWALRRARRFVVATVAVAAGLWVTLLAAAFQQRLPGTQRGASVGAAGIVRSAK